MKAYEIALRKWFDVGKNIQLVFFGSSHIEQEINRRLLTSDAIQVTASTRNEATLFSLLKTSPPHLLLLENGLNSSNIIRLVEKVRSDYPRINLLILTHQIDVDRVREAISLGVLGYLLIQSSMEGIETCLRLVESGKLTLSSEITQALLSEK